MGVAWSFLALWAATGCGELILDDAYAPRAIELIDGAQKRVTVAMYVMSGGGREVEIERALSAAAKRNVATEVVLEQSGVEGDSVAAENRATAERLRASGVKVAFDCPDKRSHLKVIVVDSRFVLVGSHNLTYSALTNNNEVSVLIDDPEMAGRLEGYISCLKEGTCREER